MSALNATAKAELRAAGVSQAAWARHNFSISGRWGGDACGCPDDRCIGYHHEDPDDCGCLRVLLEQMLANDEAAELAAGTEPYCLTCREWAGMFLGMEGWHHFRGDPAPGGQRALYDAGHQPVIGWTVPPGSGLSPAGLQLVLSALAIAARWDDLTAGAGEEHCAATGHAAAYRELADRLGGES